MQFMGKTERRKKKKMTNTVSSADNHLSYNQQTNIEKDDFPLVYGCGVGAATLGTAGALYIKSPFGLLAGAVAGCALGYLGADEIIDKLSGDYNK